MKLYTFIIIETKSRKMREATIGMLTSQNIKPDEYELIRLDYIKTTRVELNQEKSIVVGVAVMQLIPPNMVMTPWLAPPIRDAQEKHPSSSSLF